MDLVDLTLWTAGIAFAGGVIAVVVVIVRKLIRISNGMDDIFRP